MGIIIAVEKGINVRSKDEVALEGRGKGRNRALAKGSRKSQHNQEGPSVGPSALHRPHLSEVSLKWGVAERSEPRTQEHVRPKAGHKLTAFGLAHVGI